jgi:YVTN family beta-propeller protein
MAHPQPIADLAIDPTPTRPRLYVLNTAAKLVEVYDITTRTAPSLRTRITTGDTPLALAVSPSGTNLYVVNYGSSTLQIVDLATLSSKTVTLPASPQAVAVGLNEQVLISTIGTGTGASILPASR